MFIWFWLWFGVGFLTIGLSILLLMQNRLVPLLALGGDMMWGLRLSLWWVLLGFIWAIGLTYEMVLAIHWGSIDHSIGGGANVYLFPYVYIFFVITGLSLIYCLAYNGGELVSFFFYCLVIGIGGAGVFWTSSVLLFFFAYELLLLPSFFILYRFAKTRRCVEAAYLMFFWTQFGALFLLFGFVILAILSNGLTFSHWQNLALSSGEHSILVFLFVVGFGVKFPIWPFYGWLPKAHVEASTNFSIFLSGVLVKLAFLGLIRCCFALQLEIVTLWLLPLLIVGIGDAIFKMFYQIDLKKLVAYATVIEMHWLTLCVVSGYTPLMVASFAMLISHALISSNSFLLVDAINRRFKTRLITEMGGLNFLCPKLFLLSLINLLLFLGFPGSLLFITEVVFFSFLMDLLPQGFLILVILLYILGPIFFFRSWVNLLFGSSEFFYKTLPIDATRLELLLMGGLEVSLIWLGLSCQTFLFL